MDIKLFLIGSGLITALWIAGIAAILHSFWP